MKTFVTPAILYLAGITVALTAGFAAVVDRAGLAAIVFLSPMFFSAAYIFARLPTFQERNNKIFWRMVLQYALWILVSFLFVLLGAAVGELFDELFYF